MGDPAISAKGPPGFVERRTRKVCTSYSAVVVKRTVTRESPLMPTKEETKVTSGLAQVISPLGSFSNAGPPKAPPQLTRVIGEPEVVRTLKVAVPAFSNLR